MAERGISREEAATALGLSRRALAARLAGRVRPYTGELVALAGLLQVGIADLVAGAGGPGGPGERPSPPDPARMTERDRRTYRAMARVNAGPALRSLSDTGRFVDDVIRSAWWAGRYPDLERVTVRGGPAGGPAWHTARPGIAGAALHLPAWARRPLVVLHELAHVAAAPLLSAKAHGPQFARIWVDLVAEFMGRDTARQLAAELRREGLGVAGRAEVARARRAGLAELRRLTGPPTATGPGDGW